MTSKKCTHNRSSFNYIQYDEAENLPNSQVIGQKEDVKKRQLSQPSQPIEDQH
jgi:hypothetical protein